MRTIGATSAIFIAATLLLTSCAAAGGTPPSPAAAPTTPSVAPAVRPLPNSPDPATIVEVPQSGAAIAPVAVAVPSLGTIPIAAVGLAPDGQAQIPEDVSQVGWYQFGSAPSDGDGSVVLMGHRDSRGGAGALFDLPVVAVGSMLTVTDAAGQEHRYQVVSNESISKQVVPLADLFVREGAPQLVLISCGGEYIKARGGYLDNVVLRAVKI